VQLFHKEVIFVVHVAMETTLLYSLVTVYIGCNSRLKYV